MNLCMGNGMVMVEFFTLNWVFFNGGKKGILRVSVGHIV